MYNQYEVIGDFKDIKSYIDACGDIELKQEIEWYMNKYNITDDKLIVSEGKIAPGFGANGGGIQWEIPLPIYYLEELGLVEKIIGGE